MSTEPKRALARINGDRRGVDRREPSEESLLSALVVFDRAERNSFKRLDRRKALRRHEDVRRRIARQ